MQDFPPNSRKANEAPRGPKKVERVTSAEVVRRRRPLGTQFKETFIGGSAKTAAEYMVAEVIIPAVQDTLIDAFQGGFERLIRGETRRPRRGMPSQSPYGRTNYGQPYQQSQTMPQSQPRGISRGGRARHDFGELVLQSRQEAEEVLERMFDILSQYDTVTVADLYELTGVAVSHTDHKWGWSDLQGGHVGRTRGGGFLLDLPAPVPLSR